jgi:CDP-6-deoxy-D-xylo-4-hexulose-3-dehydrase
MKSKTGTIDKRILYAQAVYGDEEKEAVAKSLNNTWLVNGPVVKEFEDRISERFGKRYGIAVNSGSSAALLAVKATCHFNNRKNIITPACTFSTTVSSIVLNNASPVFIDGVVGRYTIDESLIQKSGHNIGAILAPQLIGGVCDMVKLKTLCDKNDWMLIDDSCDTFAPYLHDRSVASYADISITSFYGSHIITAMGMGGMIMTDRKDIRDYVIMLRDWGRYGDDREEFEARFSHRIDDIPYDGKFVYGDKGYNLKMNEASAAFGLVQLDRLDGFIKRRNRNIDLYNKFFETWEKWFHLPYLIQGAETNWLAYPLTIREDAPFDRISLLRHLEKDGIQTRVLFSGNVTRHDAYRGYLQPFKEADHIMANGFLIGAHQGLKDKDIEYVTDSFSTFLNKC